MSEVDQATAASLRAILAEREPEAVRAAPGGVVVVRSPGRVNLIGEHTDYNDGFVLPAAIDLEIRIGFVPTDDRRVELTRLDTSERLGFDLDAIGSPREEWIDYVAGVAQALAERDVPMRGLRGVIASDLPISSGLSSSAALELAAAWALAEERPPPLDLMELALVGQRAENSYVGVRSGLMDQFAVAFGRPGAALLLDCRSREHETVALPLERARLVVCDSQAPRELANSAYNERRAQCELAVTQLREAGEAVGSLRDVDMPMLDRHAAALDPVASARAQHVVAENERVLATVAAFRQGDLEAVGRLFAASHASLRDLYQVSSDELDALVEIAGATPGVIGARMTGAGFGGCTVNLVEPDALERFSEAITGEYPRRTGREATVYPVTPVQGVGLLDGP
ncbi:MAG: galactokinase [Chloroflexota bacterium]|nr:galactokinase [Chloroflexota bacterium]